MPFKDRTKRREYDKKYKRKRRLEGWTKKGVDKRLTDVEVATARDICGLLNEVVTETREADSASLNLETKLRIKLRAVEIGLRVIEATDLKRRVAVLEEHGHESNPIEN